MARHQTLGQSAVYLLAFAFLGTAARAEESPAPFTAGNVAAPYTTRGAWLEKNLTNMLGGCGVPVPLKVPEGWLGHRAISIIPNDLQKKIDLGSSIYVLTDKDLTRLFGAVWSTNTLINAKPDSYLDLDYSNDDDQVTMPGVTATLYSNSCASAVSAALSANGELDGGVATLKAALDSTIKTESANQIDLVTGAFSSPVDAAWNGGIDRVPIGAQTFIAALLYWQWYENNPTKIGRANYLLQDFNGDALYQRYSSNTATGAGVKVKVKLQALGAGMDASTDAHLTTERRLSGQVYQVAVAKADNGALSAHMPLMPSLEQVAQKASSAKLQVTVDRTLIVAAGSERAIVAKVENFPRRYCEAGLWTASPPLSNAEALEDADAKALGKRLTTCQFTFRYVTTTADVTNGAQFTPSIRRSITKSNNQIVELVLAAAPVTIAGANLNVSRTNVVQKAELTQFATDQVKINWTTSWRLNGTAAAMTAAPTVDVTSAVLKCADYPDVNAPTAQVSTLQGVSPKTFNIAWSTMAGGKLADYGAQNVQATCKITASIVIHAAADVPQTLEDFVVIYPTTTAKPAT